MLAALEAQPPRTLLDMAMRASTHNSLRAVPASSPSPCRSPNIVQYVCMLPHRPRRTTVRTASPKWARPAAVAMTKGASESGAPGRARCPPPYEITHPPLPNKAGSHVCPEAGRVVHGAPIHALIVGAAPYPRACPVLYLHRLRWGVPVSLQYTLWSTWCDTWRLAEHKADTRFLGEARLIKLAEQSANRELQYCCPVGA